MQIELRPIQTPNFIIQKVAEQPRQAGFQEAPKYAIKDVDAETLSDLCDQFRKDMFAKAGKPDPSIWNKPINQQ